VWGLYKIYNIHSWLRLTLQARISYICSTPAGLAERNSCDGLEMKFASPLGGIQQAGAPEIAAKSITPCFYVRLVITSG